MYSLREKQDMFETKLQAFMADVSELVITNVCERLNDRPHVYIPKINGEINALKDLT